MTLQEAIDQTLLQDRMIGLREDNDEGLNNFDCETLCQRSRKQHGTNRKKPKQHEEK
jgi:hypothetical protein